MSKSRVARISAAGVAAVVLYGVLGARALSASYPQIEWKRQFGTNENDIAQDIAVDLSGNAYVSGYTRGTLFGSTLPHLEHAFVAKYDAGGNRLWAHQFGSGNEMGRGITADPSGNVYVGGQTHGDFGQTNAGHYDNFIIKYDTNGSHVWTKQWGSTAWDAIYSVTVDPGGNLLAGGRTMKNLDGTNGFRFDTTVTKLDADGNIVWSRRFGTEEEDGANHIATDATGNAYITGFTEGSLFAPIAGNSDAFIAKYDPDGNVQWSHQFGTSQSDFGEGVYVDQLGSVYVAGTTGANLSDGYQGDFDAFLRKYDSQGNELWTRQVGTFGRDVGYGVTVDSQQRVFLVGAAGGRIGDSYAGAHDIFASAFTADGEPIWDFQFGSPGSDAAYNIVPDRHGNLFLAGATDGRLDSYYGLADAVIAKLNPFAPADYNRNGSIDMADYVVWRGNAGSPGPAGDGTGWDGTQFTGKPDGIVNQYDFDFWKASFGAVDRASAATTSRVPEPQSVMLFAVGLAAACAGFCRQRGKVRSVAPQPIFVRRDLVS